MEKVTYKIIYNSDLIISDTKELATASVFYDKVLLPHTTPKTSNRLIVGSIWIEEWSELRNDVIEWEKDNQILFQEKIIERLPPPSCGNTEYERRLASMKPSEQITLFAKMPRFRLMQETASGQEEFFPGAICFRHDLALHLIRTDLHLPQAFIGDDNRPPREIMIAAEAKVVFSYLLPALQGLNPEQIIEVRNKVKDTREGFAMHLQKLSKGIEDRLKQDTSLAEVHAWAKSVIETELIPDYREFRRQLAAERSGFWRKVLDVSAKVFEINAAPWTPKFYGELLKALGLTTLTYTSERKERLSNKFLAMQFMRVIEDVDR